MFVCDIDRDLKIKELVNFLVQLFIVVDDGRMKKMEFLRVGYAPPAAIAKIENVRVGKETRTRIGPVCRGHGS